MKKKALCLALAAVTVFSFTACEKKGNTTSQPVEVADTEEDTDVTVDPDIDFDDNFTVSFEDDDLDEVNFGDEDEDTENGAWNDLLTQEWATVNGTLYIPDTWSTTTYQNLPTAFCDIVNPDTSNYEANINIGTESLAGTGVNSLEAYMPYARASLDAMGESMGYEELSSEITTISGYDTEIIYYTMSVQGIAMYGVQAYIYVEDDEKIVAITGTTTAMDKTDDYEALFLDIYATFEK